MFLTTTKSVVKLYVKHSGLPVPTSARCVVSILFCNTGYFRVTGDLILQWLSIVPWGVHDLILHYFFPYLAAYRKITVRYVSVNRIVATSKGGAEHTIYLYISDAIHATVPYDHRQLCIRI